MAWRECGVSKVWCGVAWVRRGVGEAWRGVAWHKCGVVWEAVGWAAVG